MQDHLLADEREVGEGIVVRVRRDEYPEDHNPRRDFDHVGSMFCDHGRYDLGDEDAEDPRERTTGCEACDRTGWVAAGSQHAADPTDPGDEDGEVTCGGCGGAGECPVSEAEFLRSIGARVVLPIFLYAHGVLRVRVGSFDGLLPAGHAEFDSGMVGVIYDTPEAVRNMLDEDATDEEIEECLRGEVEEYDAYLRGDVFWFAVEDEDGDVLESCGGFLGESDHAMQEGILEAAHYVEDRREVRERNELVARGWRE